MSEKEGALVRRTDTRQHEEYVGKKVVWDILRIFCRLFSVEPIFCRQYTEFRVLS
jgi:hypothetical protein